jgi:Na+/proline symporter
MLSAVGITIYVIMEKSGFLITDFWNNPQLETYTKTFFTDDINSKKHLLKSFLGGMFVTICMTGLDQDMMQKNLTCRNLGDSQKNMISFSIVLIFVNLVFLALGALLFSYSESNGIQIPLMDGKPKSDLLFPEIALNHDLGIELGIIFILGLIAAAYSSADSALTSLTTSFCIDFLNIEQRKESSRKSLRKRVHILMSLVLMVVIILFNYILEKNVIDGLLTVAAYTYGPLLGLFAFGIFTKHTIHDNMVPLTR